MKRAIVILTAVILTAKAGRIQFNGHPETWYSLNMSRVISRTDKALGVTDQYHIREDGVKMYGPWVIVAADPSRHVRYSLVETSLGQGIVLDTHTAKEPDLIDIAVNW